MSKAAKEINFGIKLLKQTLNKIFQPIQL